MNKKMNRNKRGYFAGFGWLLFAVVTAATAMAFLGCPEPGGGSGISGVSVTPGTTSVERGATFQFTATVSGANEPSQAVGWVVEGAAVSSTRISSTGVLSVAAGETAASLKITATSIIDDTKSGSATVSVVASSAANVTSVTISPATATVVMTAAGGSQQFSVTVSGDNLTAETRAVTWSVTGGGVGTSISANGLLTVAAGETAGQLTVRATSTVDTGKSAAVNVIVTAFVDNTPIVTSVILSPSSASVLKGDKLQFTANIFGVNSPSQSVSWSVEATDGVTKNAATTISTTGELTVAAGETARALIVTATSAATPAMFGTALVALLDPPTVTGVTITPASANVFKGRSGNPFFATVAGTNNPPQTVTWSVTGNNSTDTKFTGGSLFVAADETATSLTIKAASDFDATVVSNTVTANVVEPPNVTGISFTSPNTSPMTVGGASRTFNANVAGTNHTQNVTWTVEGAAASTITNTGNNSSASASLTVSGYETSSSITVRVTSDDDATFSATITIPVNKIGVGVDITTPYDTNNYLWLDYDNTVFFGNNLQVTVYDNNTYNRTQTFTWFIDGDEQYVSTSVTTNGNGTKEGTAYLPTSGLAVGTYNGLVVVTINGVAFAREFTFTVN